MDRSRPICLPAHAHGEATLPTSTSLLGAEKGPLISRRSTRNPNTFWKLQREEQREARAAAAPQRVPARRQRWGFRPRRGSRPLRERSAPGRLNRQSREAAALPGHRSIPLGSSGDASGQGGPLLSRSSPAGPLPPGPP